jgi:hypothetical protein
MQQKLPFRHLDQHKVADFYEYPDEINFMFEINLWYE